MTYDKAYFIFLVEDTDPRALVPTSEDGSDNAERGIGSIFTHLLDRGMPRPLANGDRLKAFGHLRTFGEWIAINDGNDGRYQQPTIKARILAALNDLP